MVGSHSGLTKKVVGSHSEMMSNFTTAGEVMHEQGGEWVIEEGGKTKL